MDYSQLFDALYTENQFDPIVTLGARRAELRPIVGPPTGPSIWNHYRVMEVITLLVSSVGQDPIPTDQMQGRGKKESSLFSSDNSFIKMEIWCVVDRAS